MLYKGLDVNMREFVTQKRLEQALSVKNFRGVAVDKPKSMNSRRFELLGQCLDLGESRMVNKLNSKTKRPLLGSGQKLKSYEMVVHLNFAKNG